MKTKLYGLVFVAILPISTLSALNNPPAPDGWLLGDYTTSLTCTSKEGTPPCLPNTSLDNRNSLAVPCKAQVERLIAQGDYVEGTGAYVACDAVGECECWGGMKGTEKRDDTSTSIYTPVVSGAAKKSK